MDIVRREEKLRKVAELQQELRMLDADINHVEHHTGREVACAAAGLRHGPRARQRPELTAPNQKRIKAEDAPRQSEPEQLRLLAGYCSSVLGKPATASNCTCKIGGKRPTY